MIIVILILTLLLVYILYQYYKTLGNVSKMNYLKEDERETITHILMLTPFLLVALSCLLTISILTV